MSDRVGQQIGNYRLERLLGSGGFAEVYLGKQVFLDSLAAIKLLHANLAHGDIEAFRSEARTLVRLIHPNIVRILDFGLEDTTPFLVMDYAPNGTLRQRYQRGQRLPLATVVEYVNQVAGALQYAHDLKVIHRDIKPENMLLGRREEILLSDFGIAIVAQSTQIQLTQETIGTIAYMAPEQIQAHPRPASDQYSLGIVAYEWLSGYPPFSGSFTEMAVKHIMVPPPSLRERVPTISPDVEQVILTAINKDPAQRFGSVRAFANALQQASKGSQVELPVSAQPSQQPIVLSSPVTPILPLLPPDAEQPSQAPQLPAELMNAPTLLNTSLAPDAEVKQAAQQASAINTPPNAPYAPTILTPPNQHYNAITPPPQVPMQRQPKPEPESRGISRRAALVAGLSAVGVLAVGGIVLEVVSHSSHTPIVNTTGQTPTTKKTTTTTSPTTSTTQTIPGLLEMDTFHRPNQTFWGTASNGHIWGGDAGNSSDFSIFNQMGQAHRTANGHNLYTAVLGTARTDFEVVATAMLDSFNNSHIGVLLRYHDDNNYYKVYADGTHLNMIRRLGGNNTTLHQSIAFPAQTNTLYTIRYQVIGTTLRAKIWQASNTEPANWLMTANDNTFQAGQGGLRPQLNQNVTLQVTMFQELVATS
ncbi:MAG TPA: protein kinase [Ktedonobacteraceae bacterium]|nr:protein kinase [Ktedonobacteraceae bacterium]